MRLRRDAPVPVGPPPEVTRSLIVVLALAAALATLVILFSQPDKGAAGPAALAHLALAVAAAACSLAPPAWLVRALSGLLMASAGVMGYAALQLGWGLSTPAFPLLSLMVCVLGAVAGWRAGVALAVISALVASARDGGRSIEVFHNAPSATGPAAP